jgi:hypothetical protein
VCESDGEKLRKATLSYDATLSSARARIVTYSGRVVEVAWSEAEPAPARVSAATRQCGQHSSENVSVVKNAVARGTVFGLHLETNLERDRATLSSGVDKVEC